MHISPRFPILEAPPAMFRRTLAPLALVLIVAATASADEIILIPTATFKAAGGRIRGQITSESPSEIKIKPATGADQAVPVDQIATITYDGTGQSYAQAEIKENTGQFAEAADLYKKAVTENGGKPLIAGSAKFHRADILTDLAFANPAKIKDAVNELDGYLSTYPTGRFVGQALESLIRLHLQAGDSAKAQAALSQLKEKVPGAADRVAILEAKILTKTGKYDQAVAGLDKTIDAAKGTPRAREAKLAKAEALVAQKKFDDALFAIQEVIKDSPPEAAEIQAVAHNTLGDCYRAAGRPKDALIAYLKTDVLFDKDKEQHPRALAMIEQLFRELKVDARADEVHDRLKQLYPQSPYVAGAAGKAANR